MIKFSSLDWSKTLSVVQGSQGEVRTIGADFYENKDGRFDEIIKLWIDAGYTTNKVEWINFYPGKHFDKNIENLFAQEVSLNPIRSWISCVRPGKSAPWHQDIDDDLEIYQSKGDLKKYTCNINHPSHGQVFMIDKQCYYMEPRTKIIEWPDYMSWHGASNCGFENHYLYHFLGYR